MEYLSVYGVGGGASLVVQRQPAQAGHTDGRLYPASVTQAPTAIVSAGEAFGFLNQPFSFTVSGANSATLYSATGLPPGLTLTNTTGVIGGTPNPRGHVSGDAYGQQLGWVSGSGAVHNDLRHRQLARPRSLDECPRLKIDSIPTRHPTQQHRALGTLQGVTDYGDNYGERVRGYITIPTTGNYYFWLAGSDSAEL